MPDSDSWVSSQSPGCPSFWHTSTEETTWSQKQSLVSHHAVLELWGPQAHHPTQQLNLYTTLHELFSSALALPFASFSHCLAFLCIPCWRQHQHGDGSLISTSFFFAYSLGRRRRDACCSIPSSNNTDSGSAVPVKPVMRVPKKVCFSFFQLEWSERYLFVFSTLFCQGKTKRFAYQIIFASEHLFNLQQNILFCGMCRRNKRKWRTGCTLTSVFLLQKSCHAPGTELQAEGPCSAEGLWICISWKSS